MEIVTILRALWHRRLFVGVVAILSVLVALGLTYRPGLPPQARKTKVGVATARILVDTPKSLVIQIAPKGSEALGARASVLSNLMVEGEVKAAIARRAGLRPKQLLGAANDAIEPETISPKAARDPKSYILRTGVLDNSDGVQLPILKIDAQAPNVERARALANAAVAGLRDYLDTRAAAEQVPDARRLRVSGLGTAQSREVVRGPARVVALGAALFVFLTGCGVILLASGFARSWWEAEAAPMDAQPAGVGAFDGAVFDTLFEDDAVDIFESEPEDDPLPELQSG